MPFEQNKKTYFDHNFRLIALWAPPFMLLKLHHNIGLGLYYFYSFFLFSKRFIQH